MKLSFAAFTLFALTVVTELRAQCDSACIAACHDLKEVVVSCHNNSEDPLYQYYHQNKLPSIEEVLSRIAGVSLIHRGEYGQEAALRMYSGAQINATISGMKIFSACTDHMDPVSIYVEPANLEAIDAVQGATGSKLGSTIGGSLDMQVKEVACTPERHLLVNMSNAYASVNNGFTSNLSVSSSGPKVSFRIGAVYRNAFDYKEGGGETVQHSAFEKTNLSASVTIRLREQDRLVIDYIGDLGWHIGFPALQMDTRHALANIGSIAYVSAPNRKVLKRAETKIYFNAISHLMDNAQRSDAPMQMTMPGWSYTGGLYSELQLAAGAINQIVLRGDYYANYTKASMTMFPENAPEMYMLTLPDNLRQFAGAYIADEWKPSAHHSFRFSLRDELMYSSLLTDEGRAQWGIFAATTTSAKMLPSASAQYSWQSNKFVSLHLTGAYGSSAPSGNQLYGYYLFSALDNYDYVGNPSLKSEKSLQADAGISFDHKIVNLGLTAFYHRLYDYILGTVLNGISPVTYGALGVKQYSNITGADVAGVDATAGLVLKQGLQSMNTLTYAYGRLSDGNPVPMLSPFTGISSLRYNYKGWHLQAELSWASAKNRINTEVGETSSRAYGLLNLRTGYRLLFKNNVWMLNFSVENVFDSKYRTYADWGPILRPGRNFVVYLAYTFGK